jgi:hypothetical protein
VAAVTRDAVPRLVVYSIEYTWPFSNDTLALLDAPVDAFGLGRAPVGGPAASVSNFTIWVALERGLVGVDVQTRLPSRRLPVAPGAALVALQYDISGAPRRVYGVLVASGGASATLVNFVDGGAGVPAVRVVGAAGACAAPRGSGAAAICGDVGTLALLTDGGALVTLGLGDGVLRSSVPACINGSCPAAIVCEPFVFRRAPERRRA